MRKHIFLAAAAAMSLSSAHAVVVVNGVAGENADGQSPFETLGRAVRYARETTETVVEIHTNARINGASLQDVTLTEPLTIRAGAGFSPIIQSALILSPQNTDFTITLNDLTVSTSLLATPLIVGCNVEATNCVFDTTPLPGTGAYSPAVTAAWPTTSTVSTLTMTSCTLRGHTGLQAGRACRDYVLTNCIVEGKPTDLPPGFSHGIGHHMNWNSSFGARYGAAEGYTEISEPRTLTLNNTVVRGGQPLGWPYRSIAAQGFYQNENATIGPVTATNSVFEGISVAGGAEASNINHPFLPPTQNANSTFVHCTFRSTGQFGTWYFQGGQPTTYTFRNCLFDIPGGYGILHDPPGSNVTLVGDANTYNVSTPNWGVIRPDGSPLPSFEATEFNYAGTGGAPNLTAEYGSLVGPHVMVTAKALSTVPAVTTDKDGHPRPMPAAALRSDIGADEINETAPASVNDWAIY